ncbi:MAG: hypothetical protein M3155_10275 [Actinomycetota bacterium]|nr:hypothetical protein [Actinomycetota bacterium]
MSPRSSHARVLLIPDPRPVASSPGARRYRLARLQVNPGQRPVRERFEHLKRCYD